MQMYELTIILPADAVKAKTQVEKLEKTIKESSGTVLSKDEWGKKKLSYPINKNTEGTYLFYELQLDEPRVGGFKRLLENDGSVLRHLLIRADSKKASKSVESVTQKEEKVEAKESKPKKESTKSTRSTKGMKSKAKKK